MERVSIFIDGANFHYGIRSVNQRYSDFKFDFANYLKHILKKRLLVDVYYYNASLKQEKNPGLFKDQQQFFDRLRKIERVTVTLCRRQRRISDDGKESYTIKGDDIHLAVDMLCGAYENKFDTAILISGDGDFAPLVEAVKRKGKKVENYHFADQISLDLVKECTFTSVIDKKIVNQFFYRETQLTIGDIFKPQKK